MEAENMDMKSCPKVFPRLVHIQKDRLHLYVHPQAPRWIVANELGREVIDLATGVNSMGAIASTIATRYGRAEREVQTDVQRFIRDLDKAKLLEGESEGSAGQPSEAGVRSIFLHLTDRCNLRCVHCYAARDARPKLELPSRKIDEIIDGLASMGGRAVTLSGGEPLLRRDWGRIVEHASENLAVTVNTNGTLVDREAARLLATTSPHIQISLDGPDPETHDRIRGKGTFNAAMAGIRLLQDAGLGANLILSMTLMKSNIARAPDMIDLAEDMGIPKLRFLPLHSQGRAKSSWSSLDASLEQYSKWFSYVYRRGRTRPGGTEVAGGLIGFLLYSSSPADFDWCSIGRTIVVDSSGDVYPCALLMDGEFLLGNLNRTGLADISGSSKLKNLVASCQTRKDRIEACSECTWSNFCRASCPAFAFLQKGTLLATDAFCDFRRRLYDDLVFEIARGKAGIAGP